MDDRKWLEATGKKAGIPKYTSVDLEVSNQELSVFGNPVTRYNKSKNWVDHEKNQYINLNLKRSQLMDMRFNQSVFDCSALTGSHFQKVEFHNCYLKGTNFQSCDFVDCAIGFDDLAERIEGNNFSQCNFLRTKFYNVSFHRSTISQTLFEECEFKNCQFEHNTLDGTKFHSCKFTEVQMCHLNLDFTEWNQNIFDKIYLPAYQIPYTIGLMKEILNANGESIQFLMEVEKSSDEKNAPQANRERPVDRYLDATDYKKLLKSFIIHFNQYENEYFPLCNLYYAIGQMQIAYEYLKRGLFACLQVKNFRIFKHLCHLGAILGLFGTNGHTEKELLEHLEMRAKQYITTSAERNKWRIHFGEIKDILLYRPLYTNQLEMVIKTNIDSSKHYEKVLQLQQKIDKTLSELTQGNENKFYLQISHNSLVEILVNVITPNISKILEAANQLVTIVTVIGYGKYLYKRLIKGISKEKNQIVTTPSTEAMKEEATKSKPTPTPNKPAETVAIKDKTPCDLMQTTECDQHLTEPNSVVESFLTLLKEKNSTLVPGINTVSISLSFSPNQKLISSANIAALAFIVIPQS
ncbi:MAG: pentapeptide repeat-containing protein [Firmicutes bacterium]|nr:pentapeptide repeat-containing protein [Bacillota bacterium]